MSETVFRLRTGLKQLIVENRRGSLAENNNGDLSAAVSASHQVATTAPRDGR